MVGWDATGAGAGTIGVGGGAIGVATGTGAMIGVGVGTAGGRKVGDGTAIGSVALAVGCAAGDTIVAAAAGEAMPVDAPTEVPTGVCEDCATPPIVGAVATETTGVGATFCPLPRARYPPAHITSSAAAPSRGMA